MEALLELFLELFLDFSEMLVRERKYKDARSRTRSMTIFYSMIAAVILAFCAFLTFAMLQKGDLTAAAVIGGIFLLLTVLFVFGAIRGHRSNWGRKDE